MYVYMQYMYIKDVDWTHRGLGAQPHLLITCVDRKCMLLHHLLKPRSLDRLARNLVEGAQCWWKVNSRLSRLTEQHADVSLM